jgi:UDP-N-acetylglucosamine 2-epimerase (non-hydrolysing)
MQIPVYHMEAGNRCFDENVPEETNRRLVDHIADFNLVYTEHARRNLLDEGLPARRIMLTGSPMREVLDHFRPQIESSEALQELGLDPGRYFLVSAHRAETVDNAARLKDLAASLVEVRRRWDLPVIMSTHPRTRRAIDRGMIKLLSDNVELVEPFGFFDYVKLQMNARCVLSDSGTIAEEAAMLGFPAVTLRDAIERPEALDAGTVITTGVSRGAVMDGVAAALEAPSPLDTPAEYGIRDCSTRVLRFLLSTATRHRARSGLIGDGYSWDPPSDQEASAS